MMTKPQVAEKACDLIDCLKMWEISKDDALEIARAMVFRIDNAVTWNNPLTGTGLKVAGNADKTIGNVAPIKSPVGANIMSSEARARVFHEPYSELN